MRTTNFAATLSRDASVFHGVCRASIPAGALALYERVYPFAWLGILAEVAPSADELIYAHYAHGFALHSMRSPTLTRLYLQCTPDEVLDNWSDAGIWDELETRFATSDGWVLKRGPIVQKGSLGCAASSLSRCVMGGYSWPAMPPYRTANRRQGTQSGDCGRVRPGPRYRRIRTHGTPDLLDSYSATCLRRVWQVQRFSWWMTALLHRFHDASPFDYRLAELAYVTSSRVAAQSLAEN
jgi:p-hydroxybenzoate 3-monooxygenase